MIKRTIECTGNIPVSVVDQPTDTMQVRLRIAGCRYSIFECGCDILTLDNSSTMVILDGVFCGHNLNRCLQNYNYYHKLGNDHSRDKIVEILICDEEHQEDSNGNPIPHKEVDISSFGKVIKEEEIDSCMLFKD